MAKDLKKVTSDAVNAALKQLATKEFMKYVGDQIASDIKKRTKLGYGVATEGGPQEKLKPLSDNYKKYRKGKVASDTSPSKSNLTFSGDMLNDLVVTVTDTKATIDLGSELSRNKEKWQREQGRVFFNISKTQISMLTSLIKKKLKEILGN